MLTQDATYLCNKLDLKVVPQASYPFFHAQMEDVWVWDKNRPTRIIPRAEVYTSGDVTVEELRGEGDEPRLTAEALAERDSASTLARTTRTVLIARSPTSSGSCSRDRPRDTLASCCSRSTSATPRPCSASTTASGSTEHWRLATERTRTGDELGVLLGGLLDLDAVDGICLSTTVPTLVREWERLAERWAHAPLLVVGPGVKTGIPIRYDDPREVGPDRIVNAVAAQGALRRARRSSSTSARRRTSTSSRRRASTSAACSRRGSRSRWRRSSRAPRGS